IVPPASCQEEFDFSATGTRVDIEAFPVHQELAHIPQYERPGTRAFVELHTPRQHHRLPATQAVQLAVDRCTRGGWRIVGNEAFSRRRTVGAGAAAPADRIAGLENFIALRASVHSTTSLFHRCGKDKPFRPGPTRREKSCGPCR